MLHFTKNHPHFLPKRQNRYALRTLAPFTLRTVLTFIFTFFIVCSIHFETYAQAELLKDLNEEIQWNINYNHSLMDGGGRMYYIDQTSLWMSNGTTATTVKLHAFGAISDLTLVGATLYFTADDGVTGPELWKSNGSVAGTVLVSDLVPGAAGSSPANLCNVDGKLFFSASTATSGRELWKSDGTAAGTSMVRDILKSSGSSNPSSLENMNGVLYFSANDGTRGYELWKSDGTLAGTTLVKDIQSELKASSSPKLLTNVNGTLYFTATDATTGNELWKSDGTNSGTLRVKDIRAGTTGSSIENLIDVNGTLMFTAHDGIHGNELWKSNGTTTGTVLVKDMNPGSAGSNSTHAHGSPMRGFTNINGILYFIASKGVSFFVYRSDGTEAGTWIVQPAFPAGLNKLYPSFTYLNGNVYFFNSTTYNSYDGNIKLWQMPYNGSNPQTIETLTVGDDYYDHHEQEMISFENNLYIFGRLYTENWVGKPFQFIKSNGLENGATVIKNVEPLPTRSSNPNNIVRVNNLAYISTSEEKGTNGEYDLKLYRTDGTTSGTFEIMDTGNSNEMIASGNKLIFASLDSTGGAGLFATEGTKATTKQLSFVTPDKLPQHLTDVDGTVYFDAQYLYVNRRLGDFWKSDGTPEGTHMVLSGFQSMRSITRVVGKVILIMEMEGGNIWLMRTINVGIVFVKEIPSAGTVYSRSYPTAVIGLIEYFVVNDGIHGNEIWRTDGTDAGTYMLFDHNTTDPLDSDNLEDDIRHLVALRKTLYFSARNPDGTWGFYATTGTSAYQKIKDIPPVVKSVVMNGKMYLFAQESPTSAYQLWISDGTESGTRFLTELVGEGEIDHTIINNVLYFNPRFANNLMRSDGTECGTYSIHTGVEFAFPVEALGTDLLFGASIPSVGMEPFVFRNIPAAPVGPCITSTAMSTGSSQSMLATTSVTPYPNPFTNDYTLRVSSPLDEPVEVSITTPYGKVIETIKDLKTNVDYPNIGSAWRPGMYIMKVQHGNEITTLQLIKN
jgi:ELWxxDGT repeat protein